MNEKKLDLNVGDTVYYVTGHDALYSIRKTRIDRVIKRIYILSVLDEQPKKYAVYSTEDGNLICQVEPERSDEMDPSQVFLTKGEAVLYVVFLLNKEIIRQKTIIKNAVQHLEEAVRVLKTIEKTGK